MNTNNGETSNKCYILVRKFVERRPFNRLRKVIEDNIKTNCKIIDCILVKWNSCIVFTIYYFLTGVSNSHLLKYCHFIGHFLLHEFVIVFTLNRRLRASPSSG
jgi:hypothetical protein